ncbi:MAG: type IV pilus assembly protein PilM [Parcubacteria group bacterium]|nr:type IV pilus assembly protein PilM [Candidatus Liptonbacteria bacterium]MBI3020083.1 type IV pilus assembly protein PilM [Parcubacteria group bacterium]
MGDLLQKIRDFYDGLFKKKGDSVIGIDIGSASIKIVQLRRKKDTAILETYGELALGPYAERAIGQAAMLSTEKLAEAVQDILREANASTKSGGIAIPLVSSLISVIDLPQVSEKQLRVMVPIEARKYIPVPISEVTLDWQILPAEMETAAPVPPSAGERERMARREAPQKKARALIVAIHNDVIARYQTLAERAALDVWFLESEIFSSARALFSRERGPALLLDIGASTTKFSIVENGIPWSTHILSRGSQDITVALSKSLGLGFAEAEEVKRAVGFSKEELHKNVVDTIRLTLSTIFSSANRMLLEFEKRQGKVIGKVVLSGGGALLKGIEAVAAENFSVEVVAADPFSKVESPAFLAPVLKEAGPHFAVAIGIALRALQDLE